VVICLSGCSHRLRGVVIKEEIDTVEGCCPKCLTRIAVTLPTMMKAIEKLLGGKRKIVVVIGEKAISFKGNLEVINKAESFDVSPANPALETLVIKDRSKPKNEQVIAVFRKWDFWREESA